MTLQITSCEVCGNQALATVLNLGRHPLCDDLVTIGDERRCKEYPIEILYCTDCDTAHQRFQVPKRELFPPSYHYRSRFTADVLTGMSALVESCERRFGGLAGKMVVDVGCNDGSLLTFFRGAGARTVGIEPTDAYADAVAAGHPTIHGYLSEDTAAVVVEAHGHPDIVTFTNVFAHIEDLSEVFASLRRLVAPHTILVIENHYLGSVLGGRQFDTFYHEHPRTYSYRSFVRMAESLTLRVLDVEFPSRYGGNIRVFLGGPAVAMPVATQNRSQLDQREKAFASQFARLQGEVERWRDSKRRSVMALVQRSGPVRAKAFPGRAAILVKLLELDETIISAVFEKPGSLKIGHYVPGTRIPIRSDDELFQNGDLDQPILNLAWHIPNEIKRYLLEHGYRGDVIDILDPADFADADAN